MVTSKEILRNRAEHFLNQRFPFAQNTKDLSLGKYSSITYFEVNKSGFILKVTPPERFPIESEVFFLNHGKKLGIAPKVIGFDLSLGVILMEYIAGTSYQNRSRDVPSGVYFSLGEATRKLHSVRVAGAGTYADGRFRHATAKAFLASTFERLIHSEKLLVGLEISTQQKNVLIRFLEDYPSTDSVLLHGDIHLGNCISRANSGVILLDPSAERGGDIFWDLGMAHWQMLNRSTFTANWNEFMSGYNKSLDLNDKRIVFNSIMIDLLLNFLQLEDTQEGYRTMFFRVKERSRENRTPAQPSTRLMSPKAGW